MVKFTDNYGFVTMLKPEARVNKAWRSRLYLVLRMNKLDSIIQAAIDPHFKKARIRELRLVIKKMDRLMEQHPELPVPHISDSISRYRPDGHNQRPADSGHVSPPDHRARRRHKQNGNPPEGTRSPMAQVNPANRTAAMGYSRQDGTEHHGPNSAASVNQVLTPLPVSMLAGATVPRN